ncbi:MAG: S-layer homology domain-containing protein [Eubacteriales bacterium]|nr:S-layer homology domain-containing protein [Eubacteriales bacterium]
MNRYRIKTYVAYILIAIMFFSVAPTVYAAQVFTDIEAHWAKSQITDWAGKGLIKGYSDGSFKPDNNITRAEFMAMVNRAFGYEKKDIVAFKDVPTGAWYYEEVAKARAAGYISGFEDVTLRPDNPITRAETAAIIMRIKGLAADSGAAAKFSDEAGIPAWSKGAVGAAVRAGIMGGYPDGSFKAGNTITRAEAVVALNRALGSTETITVTYDKAGVYGPAEGIVTVKGSVIIKAEGATLQNTFIEGDLTIDKAVGEGNVTLKNVTVKGTAYINGGGANSVHLIDTNLTKALVLKTNGSVRIVASGNAEVGQLVAQSSVKVEEANLIGEGFIDLVVEKKAEGKMEVNLAGVKVANLEIKTAEVTLSADKNTEIKTLEVKADNVTVTTEKGTTISTLVAEGKVSVTGQGVIQKAQVNVSGVSFETKPQSQEVASGVTAPTVGKGTTGSTNAGGGSSSGGSSGGGGGSGTPSVTSVPITSADVQISLGSIDFDYDFYADEQRTSMVDYANALEAPYYLDPTASTVMLGYKNGNGEIAERSAEVSLTDLHLTNEGKAAYEGMNSMKNVFQFNEASWIPNIIVLNLKSKTSISGKPVENPWQKRFEIDISGAFNIFALNSDRDGLTINGLSGQPLTGRDLQNVMSPHLLLPAEGGFGSQIRWDSSKANIINIDEQPVTRNFEGHELEFYIANIILPENEDTQVSLTARLSMNGIQGELVKEFELMLKHYPMTIPGNIFIEGDPPAGVAGEAYSHQFNVSNASGEVSFELAEGALPDGLTLSSNGTIAGTPTSVSGQTTIFRIRARDAEGKTGFKEFALTINANVNFTDTVEPGVAKTFSQNGYIISIPAGAITETSDSQSLLIRNIFDGVPEHKYYNNFSPFAEIATYNISIGSLKTFAEPLTITIPFDAGKVDSDLPLDRAVKLSYYDEQLQDWVIADASVNPADSTLTFQTSHLTAWRIEYLIRGYDEKLSEHFSVLYDKSANAAIVGKRQVTQEELSQKVLDYMEAAYSDYNLYGFSLPGNTVVIIDSNLDQAETSTMLGNIVLSGMYYDGEAHLKHDIYHELFHVVERQYFSVSYYLYNRWLMEAMADTAAGASVPDSGKMGNDKGISKAWFSKDITEADGNHEYQTSYFIAYLCGLRSYSNISGVCPWGYNAAEVLGNLKDMLVALKGGGYNSLASIDGWLKNKTPKDELCPDLPTAYLNFAGFCIFSYDSPLPLDASDSITDVFTMNTEMDRYEFPAKETPSGQMSVYYLGLKSLGGMALKVINVKNIAEQLNDPGIARVVKAEVIDGALPEGVRLMVIQGPKMDRPDLRGLTTLYSQTKMLPDVQQAQAQNKLPFVFEDAADSRIYILAVNLAPDGGSPADISVKVSDLAEINMGITHTVLPQKDEEGNIISYQHVYDITVSGIPPEWGFEDLSVYCTVLNEQMNGSCDLNNGTGQITLPSLNDQLEALFVLQGRRQEEPGYWYSGLVWKKVK